jgi:hypothetical protein
MKYGIAFPYIDARAVSRLARQAEEAGWDGIFLGDAIWCFDPMISLAAAAMVTERIRLGVMVIPMPLRRPWKVASEALNLDYLSGGRAILGLGTGATWMGWQDFPDEVTDVHQRTQMLDEGIDILTLLFEHEPFQFDGEHFHVHAPSMQYYPPKPVQQPRIPLWCVGAWPRIKSMKRVLKCDGLLPAKMNAEGKFEELQPDDIAQMKAYIETNRTLSTPFDIVVEGRTTGLEKEAAREKVLPWINAGATWWVEGLWEATEEQVSTQIHQGPPT